MTIIKKYETSGKYLKQFRVSLDFSQGDIGSLLGVSKQYCSDIENGKKFLSFAHIGALSKYSNFSAKEYLETLYTEILNDNGLSYRVNLSISQPSSNMNFLGRKLQDLRKNLGLTSEDVGKALGLTASYIRSLEAKSRSTRNGLTGKKRSTVSYSNFSILAELLKCDEKELLALKIQDILHDNEYFYSVKLEGIQNS